MARNDYIQPSDDGFAAQLQAFKTAITPYVGAFGLSGAEVGAQAADADYFSYVIAAHKNIQQTAQQWTAWKDIARDGGTADDAGAPDAPALPAAVPPVDPGIESRFRALVRRLKASPAYNVSIGEALGIEGTQPSGPDMATIQPDISARISGTEVQVKWGWGGQRESLNMCELQVDRGDGKGFVLLAFDTTPNYNDSTPFPIAPAKWTYRAIYHAGDQRVGQWSKPVSVAVGG